MEKKLKVKELLVYYVDRYALLTENYSSVTDTDEDGLGALNTSLKRILKKTMIGNISVWEAFQQKSGPWRISVRDFEKYCFKEWVRYIEDNCSGYDASALQADKDRYLEELSWEEAAQDAIKTTNDALESGEYDYRVTVGEDYIGISEIELRQKGHDMMLEAIYDIFFERFQWEKLKKDMEQVNLPSGSEYNAEITPEMMKAWTRLGSYLNYIGKRKS